MEIRKDLILESPILERLYEYSKVFTNNNHFKWSHLRNKEDYDKIYELPDDIKYTFEEIYCLGRDVSIYMGAHLQNFNRAELYPTLTSYIETFNTNWLNKIDDFLFLSAKAKSYSDSIDNPPWSIRKMIELFDEQIELMEIIRREVENLKISEIYKYENPNKFKKEKLIPRKLSEKPLVKFAKSVKGVIIIIAAITGIIVGIYSIRDSDSFDKDIADKNSNQPMTDYPSQIQQNE